MVKELKSVKKFTLIEVFGSKKVEKWNVRYSILPNHKVEYWIVQKAKKYAQKGKEKKNFKATNYLGALDQYIIYWQNGMTPSETIEMVLNDDIETRNDRMDEYLDAKITELGKESTCSIVNNYQSRIKSFFSTYGKKITAGMVSESSGSKRRSYMLSRESFDSILTEIHSNDIKLVLKLAGLNGLRISDILLELTETDNGKPKYVIRESQEFDCFYIEKFKTHKERVEIRYLVLHPEVCELLRVCGKNQDLTKVKLPDLFKDKNNELIYKNVKSMEGSIRKRVKEIAVNLGYISKTEKFDSNGNRATKLMNGKDVETHSYDFTLGFHNFRKYFTGILINLGFPDYIRLHIEGHTQGSKITTTYATKLQDLKTMVGYWKEAFTKITCSTEIRDHTDSKTLELERKVSELHEIIRNQANDFKSELRQILDNTGTEYRESFETVPDHMKLENDNITLSKKDLKDLIASEVKKALKST